jgi:glycosyltransferase involved in cell wall biosynthesis
MPKKISVIMTVYNGESFIEKSVHSILNQTFSDFEYLIVDDGSTDNSLRILQGIADPRVCIIKQKNQGQTSALIKAIEQAQGELIARIDQDDYSLSNRFSQQVEFLNTHPKVVLCGSRWEELHDENLISHKTHFIHENTDLKKAISCFNPFAHSAVMFRREAYLKVGGYNKNFTIAMDYDLFVRLMRVGEAHNIEEVLTVVRMHDTSYAKKKSRSTILESLKVRFFAYLIFWGNPFVPGFFFLKSLMGFVLPRWIKAFF